MVDALRLNKKELSAVSMATGTTQDIDVECPEHDVITVRAELTGTANADLSVVVTPYESDNATLSAQVVTTLRLVGPTVAAGKVTYFGQFDVQGFERVRVRFTNNNAGTQTLNHASVKLDEIEGVAVFVGNVASGSADSGAPVKVGGKFNSILPTLTDGQRGDLQLGLNGQVLIEGSDDAADSSTPTATFLRTHGNAAPRALGVIPFLLGGSGGAIDRQRGNMEATLLASAARTATATSADQTNYNADGVAVFLNVTGNPGGAESLTINLQGKDPVSGAYFNIATTGAVIVGANGIRLFMVHPGLVSADAPANTTFKGGVLPRTWRVEVAHSAAGSWTYSVGCSVI